MKVQKFFLNIIQCNPILTFATNLSGIVERRLLGINLVIFVEAGCVRFVAVQVTKFYISNMTTPTVFSKINKPEGKLC